MKQFITILFIIYAMSNNLAQEKKKDSLPGNPTLPSSSEELKKLAALDVGNYQYNVKDYFKKPKKRSFILSPDGKYLSYKKKMKMEKLMCILKILKPIKLH
ncbi:hypothetical protein PG911_07095 [Tenacibaculum ovolyticum]|uniref:hypothetical protein n=1 Tax=Tenacibaculum ovolyticum TaxID=104270 RepID=UPI0022F3AC0C|nr:hypothetical protein [Tenacibaculum ovolyticum]WBX78014.1 hypothetical protein PG911_07095 [Tenacibaculum ovolyticum]